MKTALITGVTGQDGSYLAEFLLKKNYDVHGIVRLSSSSNFERIKHIQDDIKLIRGDLLDQNSLIAAIEISSPDEVYNLGGQSFIPSTWNQPVLSGECTALGVARLLEAVRLVNSKIRLYQASSSEIFGKVTEVPQNEKTAFRPRNPYGVAKLYAYWITENYRERYDLFSCSGILFNHESPRRSLKFVTRKVSNGVAKIKMGLSNELRMGSLDAKRDWGFAGDYVEAMWLMLQQERPEDYVISTSEAHSVRELVETAFEHVGLNWKDYVVIDPEFARPAEVDLLLGDSSKARNKLKWQPKVKFEELVRMMVDYDVERYKESQHSSKNYD
ncbi:MAG: GDP-mannose 4,6-dehydratase [Planctomycetes bacterium RIFCSPHIGHO2_02_FULL_40_12]|nr:MAG: GDP-mannose 4,6-dehydratase [Planctomycetes bacterium RIFCSPHIGHO2_02_FULL_40_12]